LHISQKLKERSERGQAIILIAGALVGLIAMIGLMIDGGMMFVEYSRLKRATDAAAISAALQYREGYTIASLTAAATEFLQLNQVTAVVSIDTCDTDSTINPKCGNSPPPKLVRVVASKDVNFGFLPVIGIDDTTITANAVGEAASVDVVLVIDSSASMASEGGGDPNRVDDPADDPSQCNPAHSCQPFEQIKTVARDFIQTLYFPYDRVAIVTFDRDPHLAPPGWQTSEAAALATVTNLNVYQPDQCNDPNPLFGPCLNYTGSTFVGMDCMHFRNTSPNDPTSCTSSNIGGGLVVAGNEFAQAPIREDSLWVVILLASGPANATNPDLPSFPYGYCPQSTWTSPFCRDASATTRHDNGDVNYDADDYARDMADFVADPNNGQGAVIYAIGLGNLIQNAPDGDPDAGEQLLTYAAEQAGGALANHGIYYFAPSAAQLREIFRSIAENIATRLTH